MSKSQDSVSPPNISRKPERDIGLFPLRVLLYSHDSVGLGHLRRNLAIAAEITTNFSNANVLIITGSPCATQFRLPANSDLIKIPSISKDANGRYVTSNFSGSLTKTLNMRSRMLLESLREFDPQLVIMDHQLTGLQGEALDMLQAAKDKGVITIYGLRDIKDAPDVVRENWATPTSRWALSECYDRVCIYGMPDIFDARAEYAPALDQVRRIEYIGYIVPGFGNTPKKQLSRRRKNVLAMFGGGGDGVQRLACYLRSLAIRPADWDSHIITGPLMDPARAKQLRKQAKRLQPLRSVRLQQFHPNVPALLQQADAVVSMAGYNSCAEILQSGTPAVLLPRSFPRKEQSIRATRLAEMGLCTALPAADPDPVQLRAAVEATLASPPPDYSGVNLDGLTRLREVIVEELQLAGKVSPQPRSVRQG